VRRSGRHAQGARVGFREVLAVDEYRSLFSAQCFSVLGDRIAAIALAVLVFDRSHSPLLAAAVYAATYLPYVVASPPLSALADRMSRRRLMLISDLIRAVLAAAMVTSHLPVAVLYALFVAVTCLNPGFEAARSALLPSVLTGERYIVGYQLSQVVNQCSYPLGFLIGGVALAFVTPRACLAADAASFVVSALLIWRGVNRHQPPRVTGGPDRGLFGGFTLVFRDPLLRRLILSASVLAAITVVPEGVAVTQAHELHGGSVMTGLLTAATPAGTLASFLFAGRLVAPAHQLDRFRGWAPVGVLFFAVPLISPSLPLTVVCWAIGGTASCYQLPASTLAVSSTPDSHRGRLLGVAQVGLMLAQGLALLLGGALADHLKVADVVGFVGAAGALLLVWCCWFKWPVTSHQARRPQQTRANRDITPAGSPST
jgi:MFS family permease